MKIKQAWLATPPWFRKVFMGALESAGVALLIYVMNIVEGSLSFSINAALLIMVKAVIQYLRVNPDFPLKDYVNEQK